MRETPAIDGSDRDDEPHAPVVSNFFELAKRPRGAVMPLDKGLGLARKQVAVQALITAFRMIGTRKANVDPLLWTPPRALVELTPAYYGLTSADLSTRFSTADTFLFDEDATLQEIVSALEQTYSGTLGAEFMHLTDAGQRRWWLRLESTRARPLLSVAEKGRILERLTAAEGVCFRKYGHQEQDTPSITQPLMYRSIASHPGVRTLYARKLIQQGVMTSDQVEGYLNARRDSLEHAHKSAASEVPALSHETPTRSRASSVERVIATSGKVYFELLEHRRTSGIADTPIIRVEQLYPFPCRQLAAELARYPNLKTVVWCQEESRNQGAWGFIEPQLREIRPSSANLLYAGPAASALTAPDYHSAHAARQAELVLSAFAE